MGAFPKKKKQQMHDWIAHFAPKLNNSCVFDKLGDEYEASGLMQDPAQKTQMMTANGMMDMPQHPPKELYATSGIFFNMISSNLMRSSKVHMYMFNESTQAAGGVFCALPFGAHTCEVPFVLQYNIMYNSSGDGLNQVPMPGTPPGFPLGPPMDEQVRTNMRETWKHFATTDEPGWMTNEVGIFTNGEIHHVDAPFSPQATDLLHKVMCEPDMIPECSKLKCGDVKAMYKDQQCCGMPEHPFFEKCRRVVCRVLRALLTPEVKFSPLRPPPPAYDQGEPPGRRRRLMIRESRQSMRLKIASAAPGETAAADVAAAAARAKKK